MTLYWEVCFISVCSGLLRSLGGELFQERKGSFIFFSSHSFPHPYFLSFLIKVTVQHDRRGPCECVESALCRGSGVGVYLRLVTGVILIHSS